jgi:HSP20 family protein
MHRDTSKGGKSMTTLVRWQRARDMHAMQHEMARLMNAFFRGGGRNDGVGSRGFWMPALDMYESDEAFTVKAELPGFSKDDVRVEVHDNRLTLKGERKQQSDVKEAKYHRVERMYGSFQRSIRLPAAVNVDKAEATFQDGVLKLTLPKAEEAKPKSISITA